MPLRHGSLFRVLLLVLGTAALLGAQPAFAKAKKSKVTSPPDAGAAEASEPPLEPMEPDAKAAPEPVPAPAPAPEAAPEPVAPTPEAEPSAASEPAPSPEAAPEPTNQAEKDHEQAVLESPTRSFEEYERVRREHMFKSSLPQYRVDFTLEPKAFSKADLRAPTGGGFDQNNPQLFGVLIGYDHSVYKRGGVFLAGLDAGVYTSTASDPYSNLALGFVSAAPHVAYEGLFMSKQYLVPTVKLDYEFLRYNYTFQNKPVRGFKTMPRVELGAMLYLNFLEPSSAADMKGNYGINRTYLAAYYSIANDSGKQDFDLSESTFRIALHFEH